jgi:xylan 1,4-beta-xylosidase
MLPLAFILPNRPQVTHMYPFLRTAILTLGCFTAGALACAQQPIVIDAHAPATPFPHFWEQMFGSGHASLMLRQAYQADLAAVHSVTGIQYVRAHGILDDDNGVYTEDEHGNPVYNFTYVDQEYQALLDQHVRPVVEISFMPKHLAFNPDSLHPFWYKPNVSPPKSWERWDGLIRALATHLVAHFGADEVAQWYFEVWNEPNIDFWNGIPRQQSYFELYDHTSRDLKAVSPRLRVGGPATAAADWVDAFMAFVNQHGTPIDFVSSHGYADDTIANLFPADQALHVPRPAADAPENDRVSLAIHKVRAQMDAAGHKDLPLFWTEWSVQGAADARDTTFVGPGLANTIRQADGAVQMMSFWTFSDVFEEGGPILQPFSGQFGLRAEYGINKPSFYDFALLHQLGTERLQNPSSDVLVTRAADGSLVLAVWNLVDPVEGGKPAAELSAPSRTVTLELHNVAADAAVTLERVDNDHGNVLPLYAKMGSPQYPTPAQVEDLNRGTALPAPEQRRLDRGKLVLTLEPNALVLIHVQPSH